MVIHVMNPLGYLKLVLWFLHIVSLLGCFGSWLLALGSSTCLDSVPASIDLVLWCLHGEG